MKKTSSYKRILILLGLSIIILFVAYYFAYKELVKKNENSANLIDYISLESDRESYIDQTQKQILSLDSKIKKAQNIIVPTDGAASFIEQIESLAKDNGLTIKNDSVDEESDPTLSSDISLLRIRSSTGGSWSGIYKFIAELESLPNKVKINELKISNSDALLRGSGAPLTTSGEWNARFEIVVLKRK